MRLGLAVAITAWTLAAWGGRIGLLTNGEGIGAWLRIGGSLLIGLLAAAALVFPQLETARRPALMVFAVFTVVLWARSLIVNWVGDGSLPFKLVHTVLALGFFALAWWAFSYATSGPEKVANPVTVSNHLDGNL
jgi:prepilin signal peptidase PulO-like enzyme (type II secretory pathway)